MVTILPQKFDLGTELGKGFGQGLNEGVDAYLKRYHEDKKSEDISKILDGLSPEQQQDPVAIQKVLSKYPDIAKDLNKAITDRQKFSAQSQNFSDDEFDQALDILGFDKDRKLAYKNLYKNASTGGKTALTKNLLDELSRKDVTEDTTQYPNFNESNRQIDKEQEINNEIEPSTPQSNLKVTKEEYPSLDTFKDLTKTQKQNRQNQLRKENLPIYKNSVEKLRAFKSERIALDKLSSLNDTKKLPKNFGKFLNVDFETGELRFPGAANPETQEFVKIINDFTTKAKDSYGARVTNFELDRFMRRLPTLLNSDEGRRYVLEYMKGMNDLNQLYEDSLKDTYNHYKISNLTFQDAESIAEKFRGPKEEELMLKVLDADSRGQQIFNLKESAKSDEVLMKYEGEYIYVNKKEVQKAVKHGAERL